MIIFSRRQSPWVAAVFILVIAIGAFMRYQQSSEEDAANLEADRKGFVDFKKDMTAIGIPEKDLSTTVAFEMYRCGMGSITERSYCGHIGEEFFSKLTAEQKAAARPILEKHFLRR